ncbi:MAG TPA: histidine kinase, partial [Casimicrobiaceae bacterium]|nr:histidine kinase [Casimicrobiaceae bacterium]
LLLCFVNAFRRFVHELGEPNVDWLHWSADLLRGTGFGMVIGLPVAFGIVATYNLVRHPAWVRYVALTASVFLLSLVGVMLYVWLEAQMSCGGSIETCFNQGFAAVVASSLVRYGALCALFSVVFVYLRNADESARRAQDAEHERARFAQRMDEARLRMLQAQIEPHFLFNTLANVRRLYQTSPADAERMLENLMRYFAVALPDMRGNDSTLGREAELTASYLEIQGLRMGRRLQFELDIPADLRDLRLPPMMLLTLAENAIKHGVAPLPEGGAVSVRATLAGEELLVQVADTGRGFTTSSGAGTGLANIRARLSAMFGSAGRFTLAVNEPRGVVATIAIPFAAARRQPV